MHRQQLKSSLLLLLCAAIWGISFVSQSVGMNYVRPFTFNCVRSLMGAAVLLPFVLRNNKIRKQAKDNGFNLRHTITGGVVCGVLLCAASMFQQYGILYTTVGKAGFITSFYIVLVPVLGLLQHKRTGRLTWIAVAFALAGLYLLCINEEMQAATGDLLILICSLLFAVHILIIDHFAPEVDGVAMSCVQFFVCGIFCALPMLVLERPSLSGILAAWIPLGYSGILSCGVAYTLQIVGQKGMNPAVASLILSLESCFSVLAGWLLLRQSLSVREIIGCSVMMGAILLAQIPDKKDRIRQTAS